MADRNFFDNRDGGRGFGDARGGYDSSRAYSDFPRGGADNKADIKAIIAPQADINRKVCRCTAGEEAASR